MKLALKFIRVAPLATIGALEVGVPLVRMLALSHTLDLRELGFGSALAVSYATFEQITDISLVRFVFSSPRNEAEDTLAVAHGLSLLRGVFISTVFLALSPLIAFMFGLSDYTSDFRALSALFVIRSFEHLSLRVMERDYEYRKQFTVAALSSVVGLLFMAIYLYFRRDHNALTLSLYGQFLTQAVCSQLLSPTRYKLSLRGKKMLQGLAFGYPLMFNGVGLTLSNQGDRFLVGTYLGLSSLAEYSIALLVAILPLSMLSRLLGSLSLAFFINAGRARQGIRDRRRVAISIFPFIYGIYALGVITLMNIVTPAVFGRNFNYPLSTIALLSMNAFVRALRGDPFTANFLFTGSTKKLAVANMASTSAIAFEVVLLSIFGTLNSALFGRLLGETVSFGCTLYLARDDFSDLIFGFLSRVGVAIVILFAAVLGSIFWDVGRGVVPSLIFLFLAGGGMLALIARASGDHFAHPSGRN